MVELFDGLVMETDSRQYIVKRRAGVDKDGNDVFTDYKYYTKLGNALNAIVEMTAKKTIKEHDADIKQAAQIYNDAVHKLTSFKEELGLLSKEV